MNVYETFTTDEKYESCHKKVQYIAIYTNIPSQFIQKEKKYFDLYKARRRRRFFGGIFGMRNFGLNFLPPLFFQKSRSKGGGKLALIPLI